LTNFSQTQSKRWHRRNLPTRQNFFSEPRGSTKNSPNCNFIGENVCWRKQIRSARANGFVHHEALANELAARFYAVRGFDRIAMLHLRDARSCYRRWGADAKVRQLEERHPQITADGSTTDATATIQTPVDHLDLATVIKVSEAVSGEIVLEKLVDTIMRTAIEHAGAERGLLILPRGEDYRIEAEATTSSVDGPTNPSRSANASARRRSSWREPKPR